ncbi:RSP_7527 family protein [Oceaniglobus ichthyenteri]|uniref:RSP_7527 family protein n=1 Tax=Oceaniglobus ichthyenteri TaxID=2136177 RepID=UPI0013DD8BA8|nr:hypothetical protein [Oceaniglobus ichthyenteri]
MTHLKSQDLHIVEAQARALRAKVIGDGFQTLRLWVATRFAVKPAQVVQQQG